MLRGCSRCFKWYREGGPKSLPWQTPFDRIFENILLAIYSIMCIPIPNTPHQSPLYNIPKMRKIENYEFYELSLFQKFVQNLQVINDTQVFYFETYKYRVHGKTVNIKFYFVRMARAMPSNSIST